MAVAVFRASCERRMSRRDFDVFFLGTAMILATCQNAKRSGILDLPIYRREGKRGPVAQLGFSTQFAQDFER